MTNMTQDGYDEARRLANMMTAESIAKALNLRTLINDEAHDTCLTLVSAHLNAKDMAYDLMNGRSIDDVIRD